MKFLNQTFQEVVPALDHFPIMPPFAPYSLIYLGYKKCNFVFATFDLYHWGKLSPNITRKEPTGKAVLNILKLLRLLAKKCRNALDAFTRSNECNRLLAL